MPSASALLEEAKRQYPQIAALAADIDEVDELNPELLDALTQAASPKLECGDCGLSFPDFQKTGRLGCPSCYESFRELLEPALERIHGVGHVTHKGRKPGELRPSKRVAAVRRASDLKSDLERAIAAENYERAAEIRDELAALESEIHEQALGDNNP